jgi:hypothetical protein
MNYKLLQTPQRLKMQHGFVEKAKEIQEQLNDAHLLFHPSGDFDKIVDLEILISRDACDIEC